MPSAITPVRCCRRVMEQWRRQGCIAATRMCDPAADMQPWVVEVIESSPRRRQGLDVRAHQVRKPCWARRSCYRGESQGESPPPVRREGHGRPLRRWQRVMLGATLAELRAELLKSRRRRSCVDQRAACPSTASRGRPCIGPEMLRPRGVGIDSTFGLAFTNRTALGTGLPTRARVLVAPMSTSGGIVVALGLRELGRGSRRPPNGRLSRQLRVQPTQWWSRVRRSRDHRCQLIAGGDLRSCQPAHGQVAARSRRRESSSRHHPRVSSGPPSRRPWPPARHAEHVGKLSPSARCRSITLRAGVDDSGP